MTRQLTYLLVADGGTDRVLVPIIEWAIHRLDPHVEILEPEFRKRRGTVSECVRSLDTGAMMVFVHRDAETAEHQERLREFEGVEQVVPMIPVRMSEAWLLISGEAIALAAGFPNEPVSLPALKALENLADPKSTLESLLRSAAGNLTGRRLKLFNSSLVDRRVNVSLRIGDFSPLEELPAFRAFQEALARNYPYKQP